MSRGTFRTRSSPFRRHFKMAVVFFSYSHADESLRDRLEKSLAMLKRQGLIEAFHDRRIPPGNLLDDSIDAALERADLILLLVSPDFLDSEYCYGRELTCALERAASGEARVIPVVLRPCEWLQTSLQRFMALPTDGKPITKFTDLDDAFLDVSTGIRKALNVSGKTASPPPTRGMPKAGVSPIPSGTLSSTSRSGPRSSNLSLKKTFSDRERDSFRDDAFDFIARFFENSITELKTRNSSVEGTFTRIDAHQFTAQLYRDGKRRCMCRIFQSSDFGERGIAYSSSQTMSNGFNESLGVEAGDDGLFLKATGMATYGQEKRHLTFEGGAELYWGMFLENLQQ